MRRRPAIGSKSSRASSPPQRTQGNVQSFANQMVTDHTKTTSELKGLAPQVKVSLPTQMTSSQQSMLDKLKGLRAKRCSRDSQHHTCATDEFSHAEPHAWEIVMVEVRAAEDLEEIL